MLIRGLICQYVQPNWLFSGGDGEKDIEEEESKPIDTDTSRLHSFLEKASQV